MLTPVLENAVPVKVDGAPPTTRWVIVPLVRVGVEVLESCKVASYPLEATFRKYIVLLVWIAGTEVTPPERLPSSRTTNPPLLVMAGTLLVLVSPRTFTN